MNPLHLKPHTSQLNVDACKLAPMQVSFNKTLESSMQPLFFNTITSRLLLIFFKVGLRVVKCGGVTTMNTIFFNKLEARRFHSPEIEKLPIKFFFCSIRSIKKPYCFFRSLLSCCVCLKLEKHYIHRILCLKRPLLYN